MAEVTTATLLFTDLVDSTPLAIRIGDEAMDSLRAAHFAGLREAIARTGGREVKTIGDAVMAAFTSSKAALDCGVAVQQAVVRQSRTSGETLAMRVGVAVGEVTLDEGDYFGVPVVEASRLCAKAEPGQILVTDLVRLLAGGRGNHEFTPVGALELKGLPRPVETCVLAWAQPPDEAGLPATLPLPSSLASTERTAFVGRADALTRLHAALEATTRPGPRRIALVAGEPGIGKTRLAAEFCVAAHAAGATVLLGRCDEEALLPYQPFVELLRYYVAHSEASTLTGQLGRGGPEIARLVPELRERVPGIGEPLSGDPESDRYRLFDGVCTFLENIAGGRPLVLLLDDLHWADKPTLLMLRHIVRSAEAAALMVVGTYRETDLDRQHPLTEVLADLRREPGHERILLRGLDVAETEALLQTVAPHEVSPGTQAFAEAVHRETEGNPFFLHEIVQHFKETGTIYERDGLWRSDVASIEELGIPEGVKDVVGRRLSRLSADCQAVLSRAAVQGRDFELAVLEGMSNLDPDRLLDLLDEALAAGLVDESDGRAGHYHFSHALVRQALYSELNTTRRVRLHRQVGEALEALGAGEKPERYGALAYHFCEAATSGVGEQAIRYSALAADGALEHRAYEETEVVCRRALEVAEGHAGAERAGRAHLLALLATATHWLGDAGSAATIARDALALMDADTSAKHFFLAADALLWGSGQPFGVVDHENIERHLEAVRRLESAAEPQLLIDAHRNLSGLYYMGLQTAASEEHLDRAITLATERREPSVLSFLQADLGDRHWGRLDLVAARKALEKGVDLGREANDPRAQSKNYEFLGGVLHQLGDVAALRHALQGFQTAVLAAGSTMWIVNANATWPAGLAWVEGDASAFDRLNAAASERSEAMGGTAAHLVAEMQRVWQRRDQGRLAEVWDVVEYWAKPFAGSPTWAAPFARLQQAAGDIAGARETLREIADDGFGFSRDTTYLTSVASAADTCALLGAVEYAQTLYDLAFPLAHLNADIATPAFSFGSVSQQLGMLASLMERYGDAERHFEDALAMNGRMGHRPALAKTKAEYAAMLLKRSGAGDGERARALATAAIVEAESMGMRPTVERAQEVLSSLGHPKRRAYPAGLSEREVEVLRLVAHGLTNAQVAEALVVSQPTVASHLQSVFNKTGSPNRAAATRWFGQSGLDTSA